MAFIIDPFDKYEDITGKIIDVNNSGTLIISVTSPFIGVIKIQCISEHYDVLHPPVSPEYNWIDWVQGDAHPIVMEASAYYNTNDKCFYKKEYGKESEWEHIDFENLYEDNPHLFTKNLNSQVKYDLFLSKYIPILHKEQVCHFSAYAIRRINRDWKSIQNNEVERHPGSYTWIYDPDTFWGEKWDTESIDGLVKDILPSREGLEELLKRHDAADEELKRKKRKEKWERIKSTPERLQNWLTKYNQIFLLLTSSLVGAIVTLIATLLITRNQ